MRTDEAAAAAAAAAAATVAVQAGEQGGAEICGETAVGTHSHAQPALHASAVSASKLQQQQQQQHHHLHLKQRHESAAGSATISLHSPRENEAFAPHCYSPPPQQTFQHTEFSHDTGGGRYAVGVGGSTTRTPYSDTQLAYQRPSQFRARPVFTPMSVSPALKRAASLWRKRAAAWNGEKSANSTARRTLQFSRTGSTRRAPTPIAPSLRLGEAGDVCAFGISRSVSSASKHPYDVMSSLPRPSFAYLKTPPNQAAGVF